MKNAFRYLSLVSAAFTLSISLPAYSAYQYTYTTTAPFDYFLNTFTAENNPSLAAVTQDNSFRLVITSDHLLTASLGYTTEQYLADATFDFSVGNYNLLAKNGDYPLSIGDSAVLSDLSLKAVDSNGLPTEWNFSAEFFTQEGFGYFESMRFVSSSTATIPWYPHDEYARFSVNHNYDRGGGSIDALSQGVWTLNEISSPVPEPSESAMFLAGLGVLSFLARRKTKQG